jgi:hypothetical protein
VILKDLKHSDGNFTEKQKIELNKVCVLGFKLLRISSHPFSLNMEVPSGVLADTDREAPRQRNGQLCFLLKILPRKFYQC